MLEKTVLSHRSNEKEILDLGPGNYTAEEFIHCQKMLYRINKILGFFHGTANVLKKCGEKAYVMDVGCGAGLFILNLSRYFPKMTFHGIDISSEAIDMANHEKSVFTSDTSNVQFEKMAEPELTFGENSVDIILATMVCHHMSNQEIIAFFKQALRTTKDKVIINDLHRNSIAYWFYQLFSPILFRNRLITNDGLISIKRGFIRQELITLLEQAGMKHYQVKWCFPFRWRVIIWKK
ncbi:MAG: 2-polyprenyl-3-methyl-5-hydroxy-6-metoxy-1,4-benzoquinol methylase [Oleiphilaceae bacterium]|jgi:2-polyprenyl-3-methyl-5-hydroxy-6-metoxy-1,4-benzoquinol methylase